MGSGKPFEKGLFLAGLVGGFGVGACGFGLIAGFVCYIHAKSVERDVRRGWNLTPVVVAAEDLHPGQKITFEEISQRNVPEQFVTASIVKPDSASYILGQPLAVPLKAGDPVNWADFVLPPKGVRPDDPPVYEECQRQLSRSENEATLEPDAEAIRARLTGAAR